LRIKDFLTEKDSSKKYALQGKTLSLAKVKKPPSELVAFIEKFKSLLPLKDVLVSGVDGRPPRVRKSIQYNSENRENTKEVEKPWLSYGTTHIIRKYTLGFVIDKSVFGLVDFLRKLPSASEKSASNYYRDVLKPVADFVRPQFLEIVPNGLLVEHLRIGLLSGPLYRIWFDVSIRMSFGEFITDVGRAHLTSIGLQFVSLIGQRFSELLINEEDLLIFLRNQEVKTKVMRELENQIRELNGFHKIGDGNASETLLTKLVAESYSSLEREKVFSWLGLQRLDMYIPELRVALEYNGEQHYESIDLFGGVVKLEKQKKMDALKTQLCFSNGIIFVEWPYWEKIEREKVKLLLNSIITLKSLCMFGFSVRIGEVRATFPPNASN